MSVFLPLTNKSTVILTNLQYSIEIFGCTSSLSTSTFTIALGLLAFTYVTYYGWKYLSSSNLCCKFPMNNNNIRVVSTLYL